MVPVNGGRRDITMHIGLFIVETVFHERIVGGLHESPPLLVREQRSPQCRIILKLHSLTVRGAFFCWVFRWEICSTHGSTAVDGGGCRDPSTVYGGSTIYLLKGEYE